MDSQAVKPFCSLSVSDEDADSDDIFYSSADSRKSSTSGLFSGSLRSSSDQPWEKEFDMFVQQSRQSTSMCCTANQFTATDYDQKYDQKRSEQAKEGSNVKQRSYGDRLCRSFSESSGVGQLPDTPSRSASTSSPPSRTFTSRPLCTARAVITPHDSPPMVTRAPSRAAEILRQFSLCWS